jgi:hypothetical protein
MNREVQHVDKGSKSLNYKDFRAKVILTHAKFNLRVNYAPVKLRIVYTILQKIYLKNILRYIVSFCIPKAICFLMEFAKSQIRDVILGTGDLLRKVISKISFRLISAALLGFVGRRSFHSINYDSIYNLEGKQSLINMSLSAEPPRINLNFFFVKPTAGGGLVNYGLKSRIRPLLVGTNVLIVKLTDISRIKFLGRAFLSTASNTPLGLELAKENKPANIHGIITA